MHMALESGAPHDTVIPSSALLVQGGGNTHSLNATFATASTGARQRNATPTVPLVHRRHAGVVAEQRVAKTHHNGQDKHAKLPSPPPYSTFSRTGRSLPNVLRSFVAAAVALLAAALLLQGIRVFIAGLRDDSRAHRIAVFREFLRRTAVPGLPLPANLLRQSPPQQLQALWIPSNCSGCRLEFQLDLMEVPLTAAVIGDDHDADDEFWLPIATDAEPDSGKGAFSKETIEDLPLSTRQSMLYRAMVPASAFWEADDAPGRLEVWLPDGRLLLQHAFDPVRWLPAKRTVEAVQGDTCKAVDEALDPLTGWCSRKHGVIRLCYALPSEDGPWDGAVAQDCEHSHRNPIYVPLSARDGAAEHVEFVLRGRMDAYVHASETTKGCSNCLGAPYGDQRSGTRVHACGDSIAPQHRRRCFGDPPRLEQAVGLAMIGIGFALFVPTPAIIRLRGVHQKYGKMIMIVTSLASFVLLLTSFAVHLGLPGMVRRTSKRHHVAQSGVQAFIVALVILVGLLLCAMIKWTLRNFRAKAVFVPRGDGHETNRYHDYARQMQENGKHDG